MSKTRNISDLLDANGDVKSGALDNVPASTNASALSSGTLPDGRFPATLPAASGVNLTALNASNVASGTLADARLSSNITTNDGTQTLTNKTIASSQLTGALPALDGSALTNLSGGVSSVKTFFITSSQTYTPTAGTKFVTVYCNGAGGGGGNHSGNSNKPQTGGGGGAGGMAIVTWNATELGANASITIGSGGSGGASHHDPRDGSSGGDSTVNPAGTGATITGNGGGGGIGSSNARWGKCGSGGAASSGLMNIRGQHGFPLTSVSGDNEYRNRGSGGSTGIVGSSGGQTMFTGSAYTEAFGSSGDIERSGSSGGNGCGGQGAMAYSGYNAGGSGGSGGSGYVVIMEYA